MKRLICFVLVITALVSGCAGNATPSAESSVPSTASPVTNEISDADILLMQIYMEDLLNGLYDHETSVYEWEGGFSIHISMTGGMSEITFADFVIAGTQEIQEHLPEFDAPLHEFSVSFTISDPSDPGRNGSMLWVSEDLHTGILTDTANGRNYFNPAATLQDVADLYGVEIPSGE